MLMLLLLGNEYFGIHVCCLCRIEWRRYEEEEKGDDLERHEHDGTRR